MAPVTLQVYSLVDVFLSEYEMASYEMASPHSFNKSQAQKKKSEPFEADIGICPPAQNPLAQLVIPVHRNRECILP